MNANNEIFDMENGFNYLSNKYVEKLVKLMGSSKNQQSEDKKTALFYLLATPEDISVQGRCINKNTGYKEFSLSNGSDGYMYFLRLGVEALITQAYNAKKELEEYKKKVNPKPIVNEKDAPELFNARKELSATLRQLDKANSELSKVKTLITLQNRKLENLKGETKKQELSAKLVDSNLNELREEKKKLENEISGMEKRYTDEEKDYLSKNKDLQEQYDVWVEELGRITKGIPMKDNSIDSVGSVISGIQKENEKLKKKNDELSSEISSYKGLERVLIPELQQMLFTRSTQGKSIRLSAKEIEDIFRMSLTGYTDTDGKHKDYTYYAISKKLGVSHTTVKKLLDIDKSNGNALKDYRSVASLEKIVKGLNRVSKNGNFTGLKKNKLSKYINYYTSALEQARRYRDTIRLEFNSNNHTLMDLANTMSNIRNSKKGMAEDDAAFDLES